MVRFNVECLSRKTMVRHCRTELIKFNSRVSHTSVCRVLALLKCLLATNPPHFEDMHRLKGVLTESACGLNVNSLEVRAPKKFDKVKNLNKLTYLEVERDTTERKVNA